MPNKKIKLADLKVKSLVTVLDQAQQEQAKGGYLDGRNSGFDLGTGKLKGRWTEVKTRAEIQGKNQDIKGL